MNIYHIKNTSKDNSFKIIVGGILIIMGAAAIEYYAGYIFLLIAFIIAFFNSGTEFNLKNSKVRTYFSFFGIKSGEWKHFSDFYSISYKQTRKGYRTYSRSNTSSVDVINTRYEVYLMGKKRSDTILMFDSKDKKKSKDLAFDCSQKTGFLLKPYGAK